MASTHPTNVKRIVILQKKSSRIFCKKPFDTHTDPILGVIRIFANIEVPWYVFVSSWKFYLLKFPARTNIRQGPNVFNSLNRNIQSAATFSLFTGLPVRPVIKWAFGRLRRKTASRGREDTRVWYRHLPIVLVKAQVAQAL